MKIQQKRKLVRPVIAAFAVAVTCLLFITGCSKDKEISAESKTFVMVHGAFQGPYAWQFVKSQLEAAGQKVVVVELPGHGTDQTPPGKITIKTYRDKVVSAIAALKGQVVLVGHSLGGAVITAVADTIPGRIEKLVYIAGFVPANGQSILDLTLGDPNSQFGPALMFSADGTTASIPNDKLFPVFCQDGTDAIKQLLIVNNRPEPIAPQANKLVLTNPAFAAVPKYYIHTTKDHAITIDLQNKMVSAAGIKNVYSVDSGHCPFLSVPDKITAILLQIIK